MCPNELCHDPHCSRPECYHPAGRRPPWDRENRGEMPKFKRKYVKLEKEIKGELPS